jgi:glycosyltransferase involved in cell wall biosynthesis
LFPQTKPRPPVSVIVPVYNGERFLTEALDSILAQTYSDFELIVVDDGSTDRSREIAQSYPSALHIRQDHAGTAAARNRGLQSAGGDFIAFLDHDDLWLPDKLASQMAAFEANPDLDAVSGLVQQFIQPGHGHRYSFPAAPQPGYSTTALLIKKDVIADVGDFPEGAQAAETIEWFSRFIAARRRLLILQQVVAMRRIHGGNASLRQNQAKSHSMLLSLKAAIDRKRVDDGGGGRA